MLFLLALPVFLFSGNMYAQEKVQVTGKVTEAITGEALPGVSILVKGTTTGTITDIDGKYLIMAGPNDILVFSFIGYEEQEVSVGNNTQIDISLAQDIIGLDEVIVTGYGVQKKSDLTGAIASVSAEDLTQVLSGTVEEALKGRAAGVFSSSETGAPGSDVVFRVRGISSINAANPVVVIDGLNSSTYALSALNPGDIQSIEILKDASSAAIYGASGGAGVILVTTKQGIQNELRTELNYSFGLQDPYKRMDMMNTEEYFETYFDVVPEARQLFSPDTVPFLPDVDYQDEVLRRAPIHNIDFSIAGGNEVSTYRFSTGYFSQLGVIPNSSYHRVNVRLNSQHQVFKWLKIGENVLLANETYNGFEEWNYNDAYASPLVQAWQFHPFATPYDENGDWNLDPISNVRNPFVAIDVIDRNIPRYRLIGDLNAKLNLFKGFVISSIVGGDIEFMTSREFTPVYYFNANTGAPQSIIKRDAERNYSWYVQNYATYDFNISSVLDVTLMAGHEAGYYLNENQTASRYSTFNENRENHYFSASQNNEEFILQGRGEEVSTQAFYGRVNLVFLDKYLVTANLRRDYSSKFGPDYRAGNFPAISVGWKFSEEAFIKNNAPFISFGKIRAGWGKTGNSNFDPYRYFAQVQSPNVYGYAMDNDNQSAGAAVHGIENTELHWEEVASTNVGLDLNFFANRLSLSTDYFVKQNIGMIIPLPVPDFLGTYQQNADNEGGVVDFFVNQGDVRNSGVEVTLGFKNIKGEFKHDINFNASYIVHEVGDIGGDTIISTRSVYTFTGLTFTAQGEPMGSFYGYKTDGLFRQGDVINQEDADYGDIRWVDVSGDGVINSEDRTIIGNPHPKILLGFNYSLSWKNFDFSMFWQGAFGHDIMRINKVWLYNNSGGFNWHRDVLDRYTENNTDAELFRTDYDNNNNNTRMSDWYISPGDYLRLKNIQIGYTLPQSITSIAKIDKLRVYAGVRDLLTITKYDGLDPEIAEDPDPLITGIDVSSYPRPRVFIFGLNVIF